MRDELLLIKGNEVRRLLMGQESGIINRIRNAYEMHRANNSVLPQSAFLRLKNAPQNRIIALPAMLGGEQPVIGMKWIASFPGNVMLGGERATAVVVLNSIETGTPTAIIEGSVISAKRTAASAALAVQYLSAPDRRSVLGLIGCGRINFEIAQFIDAAVGIQSILLYDIESSRTEALAQQLSNGRRHVEIVGSCEELLARVPLVSFATTVMNPYVRHLATCASGATLLNISLRDFAPEAVLEADNIVDDLEHVCRESTSIQLAFERAGHRAFVRCTLGDVMAGAVAARQSPEMPVLFSPFGLGILDMALAAYVVELAQSEGIGIRISDFQPAPWFQSVSSAGHSDEHVCPKRQ